MNTKLFVLPSLCLGGAALLLAPAPETAAFSKIGGSLNTTQRDVRLFDNFADTTANNNATPAAQFPGYTGAELAIWKGIVEWGSTLHGDGTGDPISGNLLGDGGANFDAFWAGNASAIGTTNHNIVSAISSCGGTGTLAYTETPISDGWRIRFCDEWTWDDGPGGISNRWDIQGIQAHEYGHALGLGHSGSNGATMFPSVGAGQLGIRSIHPDDVAGIKCIYGVASSTKPQIFQTSADGVNITITGANFDPTNNEVWFCPSAVTANNVDPIVRVSGLAATAGQITLAIPAAAGPGDVIVKIPGTAHATVSNAFPTDLVGDFGTPPEPTVSSVTPSTIQCLLPGTSQTIVINGTDLDLATDVLVDGNPVDPSRYTVVSSAAITLNMVQVDSLGTHTIGVTDGSATSNFNVNVVAVTGPLLEFGNGDPLNVIDRDNGVDILFAGPVGTTQFVYASLSDLPSTNTFVNFSCGNNFTDLNRVFTVSIPAKGWTSFFAPTAVLPDPGFGVMLPIYLQGFRFLGPAPFPMSNLQSILLTQ